MLVCFAQIQRIILCVFLKKDVEVYEDLLRVYFPLPPRDKDSAKGKARFIAVIINLIVVLIGYVEFDCY